METKSQGPKFASPDWVLQRYETEQSEAESSEAADATKRMKFLVEEVVGGFDMPDNAKEWLIAIFYEELDAVEAGKPSPSVDESERQIRETFRRKIEQMSPEVRRCALSDSPVVGGRKPVREGSGASGSATMGSGPPLALIDRSDRLKTAPTEEPAERPSPKAKSGTEQELYERRKEQEATGKIKAAGYKTKESKGQRVWLKRPWTERSVEDKIGFSLAAILVGIPLVAAGIFIAFVFAITGIWFAIAALVMFVSVLANSLSD